MKKNFFKTLFALILIFSLVVTPCVYADPSSNPPDSCIHIDGPNAGDDLGINNAGNLGMASGISGLMDKTIDKVWIFIRGGSSHEMSQITSFSISAWNNDSSLPSATALFTQDIPVSDLVSGWNCFELTTPYVCMSDTLFWGCEMNFSSETYLGTDAGPQVPIGCVLKSSTLGIPWTNSATYSFNVNFNIRLEVGLEPPVITIGDYVTTPTNQDIVVTATTDHGTLNAASHTFTENGSFDFVATDSVGNVTTKSVTITNIDKAAPVITVGDYVTTATNQDIVVTATTSEGTLNAASHTFTENGSFDFVATDSVGNVTTRTVTITNIDKVAPVITIGDYVTTPTNQDIVVTATTDHGTLNAASHTFTENGSFDFVATDSAGNATTKSVTITNIDKVAPAVTIGDYVTTATNQDIVVTATTSEGTLNAATHTFTENGTFDFVATDSVGNVTTRTATITNIDKVVPVVTVGDYVTTLTNQDIVVTATTSEGTLNAATHTFTENGTFDFVATDSVGNVTTRTVTITNIDKVAPVVTVGDYVTTPTNQDIVVTATTSEGTLNAASHTFTENESFDFVATDSVGNVTTRTVTITNIDKVAPAVTIGDYVTTPTNQDIVVIATTDHGTLNAASHTFTENGTFDFVATDSAGNATSKSVSITNIDKIPTVIFVKDSQNNIIDNKGIVLSDKTVRITFDEGIAIVTKNGQEIAMPKDGVFVDEGVYHITVVDAHGNSSDFTFTIAKPSVPNINSNVIYLAVAGFLALIIALLIFMKSKGLLGGRRL